MQREIVGFYDKGLIVGELLPVFEEFEIQAIDECEDEKSKTHIWAIIEDIKQKTSKNGKPFLTISASGMSEKKYSFKVWNTDKSDPKWQEGNILTFSLDYNEQYGYNVSFRSKVMKIEK